MEEAPVFNPVKKLWEGHLSSFLFNKLKAFENPCGAYN